jgi:thioredoxin family protein
MTKTPALRGLLAGLLLIGSVTPAFAQGTGGAKRTPPTPAQMLDPRLAPKHDDVSLTTPSASELAGCTVEQVLGQAKGSSGWVLLDAKKQPVRRFFDTTGRGNVDMWSYFKDGIEVYREFDTTGQGSPDNFRWLNAAGMKWGVGSVNKQGKAVIRAWNMISAEEVSYEAFQAVQTNDFARLQALFVTENDLSRIKLPAAKIKSTLAIQTAAAKKFADLAKEVNLAGAKFDHVESAVPHCDTNSEIETIKYASRAVRYVIGAKEERKWIHTNEIVQVGPASWRLVDVPSGKEGNGPGNVENPMVGGQVPAEAQKIMDQLAVIDKQIPNTPLAGAQDKRFHGLIYERITLVQKMIPLEKEADRENWYKQLFDNQMAMAQNMCDEASLALIKKFSDEVIAQMPKSSLAPYGAYRLHWSTYTAETHVAKDDTKKIAAAQEKFLTSLGDFVKKFPSAEDAPEALYQLGSGCEFSGKIEEAKRWYAELAKSFPKNHMAARAEGCVRRLNLVGNALELSAPYLADSSKKFDMSLLKDKVVVVHFWSSQSENFDVDFRKLKLSIDGKKNVELVCVNLDDSAAKATEAVRKTSAPGIHVFQPGNNNVVNPLGIHFGIQILPTVFVVDRNGRVSNNAVQLSDLDSELKKVQ